MIDMGFWDESVDILRKADAPPAGSAVAAGAGKIGSAVAAGAGKMRRRPPLDFLASDAFREFEKEFKERGGTLAQAGARLRKKKTAKLKASEAARKLRKLKLAEDAGAKLLNLPWNTRETVYRSGQGQQGPKGWIRGKRKLFRHAPDFEWGDMRSRAKDAHKLLKPVRDVEARYLTKEGREKGRVAAAKQKAKQKAQVKRGELPKKGGLEMFGESVVRRDKAYSEEKVGKISARAKELWGEWKRLSPDKRATLMRTLSKRPEDRPAAMSTPETQKLVNKFDNADFIRQLRKKKKVKRAPRWLKPPVGGAGFYGPGSIWPKDRKVSHKELGDAVKRAKKTVGW